MSTRRSDARPQEARQQAIAEFVAKQGSATAVELAELTGVSVMTVHRDLDELARRGLLRKFRGGVSAQPSTVFESDAEYRLNARIEQKRAIAARAAEYVEPGGSIILDDSTTALQIASLLEPLSPLTVVTNYRRTIDELRTMKDVRLIALGGDYSRTHDSFNGLPCTEALSSISVDTAFISTSAMTAAMTYHQEQEIVVVKRAMLAAAATKVLLMDSSKMPRTALHHLAPADFYDRVIVDDGVDAALLAELRDHVTVDVAVVKN
ncbi:DeoR/GlpR family transcriptional regulator of sugar metabolism [Lipingzhangella halophila]|uniref:DeoR/GlpR family transcriptional regulator of sugar metabolism n=1 Tax=Lipingzhangella halophila TaxID=1783352 RepID=A0A7W7RMP3_9ACTN|nr:DeoR/GlpR family DNA-binding transcription regulator [Lipingzhangella halophila]MBB4934804.1 DeoR/GlpR family transcriptional regulator of sugar metabolism [Lipingzhangella halophila]